MFFRVMFKFMLHQYFILIFTKSQNLIDPVKSQPPHKTEVNKKYLVLCITSLANYTADSSRFWSGRGGVRSNFLPQLASQTFIS